MATIEEFIAALGAMTGWPYDQWPQRLVLGSGRTDCSGSQFLAYKASVGVAPGGTVSSSLARWCYEANNEITVEQGKAIRGAWVFWGPDRGLQGFGNDGHIVVSLGDGTCLGTPGYNGVLGVVPWEFFGDYQPSGAALIPGLIGYDLSPLGGTPPVSAPPVGQAPVAQSRKWKPMYLAQNKDHKDLPTYFCRDGIRTYVATAATITALQMNPNCVHVGAQSEDFFSQFLLQGKDYQG